MNEQIRVAYQHQNQPMLKMVFNPNDQSKFSRLQTYYRYFTEARRRKIAQVSQELTELEKLQGAVRFETEKLQVLKVNQQLGLQKLEQKKQQRKRIIAGLDQQLSSQGAQLSRMKKDASKLNQLITSLSSSTKRLTKQARRVKKPDSSPFKQMKGRLRWPANGGILHRYGTSRNGSSLKWQGVLINAPRGSAVKAISNGQVIFSDWFQNLGQLIIVDHGDGFMSLYGHNSELLKSLGDSVKTGEVIASVGDSGGRKNSGLYFEVRQKGVPINPAMWCNGYYK